MTQPTENRVGLAFGGGLPFGLVALGVLRALEEHDIRVHRLAGTSMGSIIAATYASGVKVVDCVELFREAFTKKRLLSALLRDVSFSGRGILRGKEIVGMLEDFVGRDRRFEDLSVPLKIPACDLADGSEVVFESGPLLPAIRASISLPGILAPFQHEGQQLVDGALIRPIPVHLLSDDEVELKIPVRAVRRRTRQQLHSDVQKARRKHRLSSIFRSAGDNIFGILWQSMSVIMQDEFAEMIFDDYDIYIKPQLELELSRDPSKIDEIVQAGHDEAVRTVPAIKSALEGATKRDRMASLSHDPLADALDTELSD